MYTLTHCVAEMPLADYQKDYRDPARFIGYCKVCDRYDACWACPPFAFDTEEYIAPYQTAYLIGTKIIPDKGVIEENQGWEKCKEMAYGLIAAVRPDLDGALLALEQRYSASKAFFAGTCHVCPAKSCTRIVGKPCVSPEKARPSLESLGFDIGKTTCQLLNIELKWSQEGILPEYLTLVSGFFTREAIPDFSRIWHKT